MDQPSAVIYQFPMASNEALASPTEEVGSVAVPADGDREVAKEEPRGFLKSARKNLSEEDLGTPAARRFLIAEIERLDQRCAELQKMEGHYNDLRVELATLKEQSRSSVWFEIMSYLCFSLGATGLGTAPTYFAINGAHDIAWTILIGSALLVAGGISARVFK
jgi:hypothetical protein